MFRWAAQAHHWRWYCLSASPKCQTLGCLDWLLHNHFLRLAWLMRSRVEVVNANRSLLLALLGQCLLYYRWKAYWGLEPTALRFIHPCSSAKHSLWCSSVWSWRRRARTWWKSSETPFVLSLRSSAASAPRWTSILPSSSSESPFASSRLRRLHFSPWLPPAIR